MNSQYFDQKQIESGEFAKFLKCLMDEAYGDGDHYNDIHIIPADCGAFLVEWEQVNWERSYDYNKFVLIKPDEVIYQEVYFPDGHYELLRPEQVDEELRTWQRDHPEWVKTPYGTWTNEEENKAFKEFLEKESHKSEEEKSQDEAFKERVEEIVSTW